VNAAPRVPRIAGPLRFASRQWLHDGHVPAVRLPGWPRSTRRFRVIPEFPAVGALHDGRVQETLVIVDDHPVFRSIAREKLEADGIHVLGEAADGQSGLDTIAALRPTIVLVDIHLPDIDGFVVARRIADLIDPPVVVLTSSRPGSHLRRRSVGSGAAGFIAKEHLSGAAVRILLRRRP
jgi:CheY-like chemotaxis protein